MNYIAKSDCFSVTQENLRFASMCFLHAIKDIRKHAGLPLSPYKKDKALEWYDYAQRSILEGAKTLGIDLGGEWGEQIDLSNLS